MIETVETINIEPEWESMCEWFANALDQHAFERGAMTPVISFIEQVRYLALTDPDALKRVLTKLEARVR